MSLLHRTLDNVRILSVLTVIRYAVQALVAWILARLLAPQEFGVMAFALLLVNALSLFASFNTRKALVRTQLQPQDLLDTGFSFELLFVSVAAVLALIATPYLHWLNPTPHLKPVFSVLLLSLILGPFSIQLGVLERELSYKKLAWIEFGSMMGYAGVAAALAYFQQGVWALVFSHVAADFFRAVLCWIFIKHRPRLRLQKAAFKELVHFGLPLTGAAVAVFWYWNIDDFWVGRLLNSYQLGLYWFAFKIPHYCLYFFEHFSSVAYSAYAKAKDDAQLQKGLSLATHYSAILYLFALSLSLVYGHFFMTTVFGQKWEAAVPAFQIFMVLVTLRGTTRYWSDVAMVKGESRYIFKLTLGVAIVMTIVGYQMVKNWGMMGMAVSVLLVMVGAQFFCVYKLRQLLPKFRYIPILWRPFLAFLITTFFGLGMKVILPSGLFVNVVGIVLLIGLYWGILAFIDPESLRFIRTHLFRSPKPDDA